jgi:dsRNA-specific ribonuclease|tara:strand:- start:354 stop:1193 length:840 start_codon:yes stop_codon:yes gene_type:complete
MEQEDVPYNDKNILIGESDINKILKTYGIKIKCINVDIYRKALVHKSYTTRKNKNFVTGNVNCPKNCLPLQEECNERFEYLGDSILSTSVANYLYKRFPNENEGFLTKMRSKLVNGHMLANLCDKVGLDKWIIISKQIENNDGRKNYKIMEDTFEAFICAIFLDFNNKKIKIKNFELISGLGFQIAENWIINVIEDKVDLVELIKQNKNYKDTLIKYFQHTYMKLPVFYESNIETINNKKIFTIVVKNDNQILGTGIGETKKTAEQLASEKALQYLNIN